MKHKKYSIKGKNIISITNIVMKEPPENPEEVSYNGETFQVVSNNGKTFLYIFEKYSFMQDSDMSAILFIDIINDNEGVVNFIVAGGHVGIFQLDIFRRENSVLKKIEKKLQNICDENNWQIQTYKPENHQGI